MIGIASGMTLHLGHIISIRSYRAPWLLKPQRHDNVNEKDKNKIYHLFSSVLVQGVASATLR
jgi:hypothetical protein